MPRMRPTAVCVRAHIAATQSAKFMSSTSRSTSRLQKPEGGEKSTYMSDASFSISPFITFPSKIVIRNGVDFFVISLSLSFWRLSLPLKVPIQREWNRIPVSSFTGATPFPCRAMIPGSDKHLADDPGNNLSPQTLSRRPRKVYTATSESVHGVLRKCTRRPQKVYTASSVNVHSVPIKRTQRPRKMYTRSTVTVHPQ